MIYAVFVSAMHGQNVGFVGLMLLVIINIIWF